MIPRRFLGVLAAAVLAGMPGGVAAQVTPPNPFAASGAPGDHPRVGRHHHHRLEIRGRHLERRGERWQRHGARLERQGRLHAGRSWSFRGERLEHRGRRLDRRGQRLERHAPRFERGAPRVRERHERDLGRRRWRTRQADGWL